MKKLHTQGFTVIEFLIVALVFTIFASVVTINIRSVRAENRDTTRKTDTNALHQQLEALHLKNGFYPSTLTTKTLPGVRSESLTDPHDVAVGEKGAEYIYTPKDCNEKNECRSYVIEVELEREAPFIRESLNS